MDALAILMAHLVGRRLIVTKRREYDWAFGFGDAPALGLSASYSWRILIEGRIAFTGNDDGQKFGLPSPLDGEEVTQRLLGHRIIERISIRTDTGDLSIIFSEGAVLEVLNMSSGYESWQIGVPGTSVIGVGGGKLAIYSDNRNS
jgi:hypothetical protein